MMMKHITRSRILGTLATAAFMLAGCLTLGSPSAPSEANQGAGAVPSQTAGKAAFDSADPGAATAVPEQGDRLALFAGHYSEDGIRIVDSDGELPLVERPIGHLSPDGKTLYQLREAPRHTTIRAVDLVTGEVLRTTRLDEHYYVPENLASPAPLAFSADGSTFLLGRAVPDTELREWSESGQYRSRFAVVDTSFTEPPHLVDLPGTFWFDALSVDGRWLYLIEVQDEQPLSYSPEKAPRYQVRAYDVAKGLLMPEPVVDKTEVEQMTGYRRAAAYSKDNEWLYSLYTRPGAEPFIHALKLADRAALCIDLPFEAAEDFEQELSWALALSPDGRMLYAVNGATGQVAQVDTKGGHTVRQAATLEPSVPGHAASPVERILSEAGKWLVPKVQAKTSRFPGAVVSSDGKTLFGTGEKGLLVVDTAGLSLRNHFLPGRELNSLLLSPDGRRLYTLGGPSPEMSAVLVVDAGTGELVREIEGAGQPIALIRIIP